ncbi:MAG: ABC transporter ATP-binding protein [Thermodesulfobacteriota bacterium]
MSTFQTEEKKRTTTYDIKILKWLFGYIKTNKLFFILALFFMILTAGFEVLIPYLTKTAVDKYIYPSWVIAEKPGNNVVGLISKYPNYVINIENGNYLIDISELEGIDRTDLEKSGALGETKYIVFDTEKTTGKRLDTLTRIFNENKDIFTNLGQIHYAKFSALETLDHKDIAILRSESLQSLKILVLYIFISLICVFIFTTAFTYLLYYSGHKIMHRIRTDAFSHILKLPQSFFDRNPVGRLTTRVTNDVNAINEVYTSVLVQFIKDLLVIIGIIAIMMNMDMNLTLIILGLTVFLGLVAGFFRMRLKTVFRNIRVTIGKLNSFVQESIQGIILIKLYGKETDNFNRFREINRENYSANMSQLWTYVMFRPFIEYVTILGIAIILWYGGLNVIQFELTIGALIAFLYYVRMLFKPIQELSERYNIFQSASAASENLYDLIHEEVEASGEERITAPSATVEFKNVWFSYNDKDWVLKDVSFKILPGETIALVGLTGSGKTTIVNLILKFYQVQRGEILFNGININNIDNDSLRSNITAVFQDLFLFGKDISDEYIDSKRVESSFGLENKIDSSTRLSSGENQIVSLAKAFDKESKLLIMDEATSHIDAEIERKIQHSVRDYGKKTKIIIAHRLSNVRGADRILVIHKGEIVESGTHYELLENKGIYQTLHNFQQEIQKVSSTKVQ